MEIKDLMEIIDANGAIIAGDYTEDHGFGSQQTTDSFEKMTRQGASNFYGYRRWWGEDDETKPHSGLADKLQDQPEKFYAILKHNKKEGEFEDYFTNGGINESIEVPQGIDNSTPPVEITTLEEYSIEDPILVKWVNLVKELWKERGEEQRVIILNSLFEDVDFTTMSEENKNFFINQIQNG
tara:strand:- start:29071 stop:29616 length:546 start_codon:yes stop_codon:yes gene_type:complete